MNIKINLFLFLIILLFIPRISFPNIELAVNTFSTIFTFKTNGAFGESATYVHKGKTKDKWDVAGWGLYFTPSFNIYQFVKLGGFIGMALMNEKLDSFNDHASPSYKINHFDFGAEARFFPLRQYLYIRLGYVQGISKHKLKTSSGSTIDLFEFKGRGYQAGFGIDIHFDGACLGYNCGFQGEYLVRKAWSTAMNVSSSELAYNDELKTSYREQMLSIGMFWFY